MFSVLRCRRGLKVKANEKALNVGEKEVVGENRPWRIWRIWAKVPLYITSSAFVDLQYVI